MKYNRLKELLAVHLILETGALSYGLKNCTLKKEM